MSMSERCVTVLHCNGLNCSIVNYTAVFYTVVYYTVVYYTVTYYTAVFYTATYWSVLYRSGSILDLMHYQSYVLVVKSYMMYFDSNLFEINQTTAGIEVIISSLIQYC